MVFNGQGKEKKTQTHSLEETCAFLCHHEGKFRIANGEREIRAPSFEASLCVCVCLPACVWQRSTRGLLPPLPALVFSPLGCCAKTIFCRGPFFSTLAENRRRRRPHRTGRGLPHAQQSSRSAPLTHLDPQNPLKFAPEGTF